MNGLFKLSAFSELDGSVLFKTFFTYVLSVAVVNQKQDFRLIIKAIARW